MRNLKNKFWDFDSKGGMVFHTKSEIIKKRHRNENKITLQKALMWLTIIMCSLIDIFVIYQLFTPLMNGNILYRIIASSALFIGFDIAPVIFGNMYKKKEFGYSINKVICAILVGAFVIAVLVNLDLRMHTQDSAVDTISSENLMDDYEADEEDTAGNPISGAMARALSFFPLITSLVSFGASYNLADPLKKEIQVKEKELDKLEADKIYSEAALKEYEKIPSLDELMNKDRELLDKAMNSTYITGKLFTDHVRNYLLELIETTASGITYISDNPQEEYDTLMKIKQNKLITENKCNGEDNVPIKEEAYE